ncbi:MAG: ABC transporter ATP-binding protein [Rhodovulum sp.]|nr:ABC transporter ATP-binding protein [Rhodovulum sp.]
MTAPLLEIEDLAVDATGSAGTVRILDGVSIGLGEGETLGVVGESGSGKSTLAAAIPRLLGPGLAISAGRMRLAGEDVMAMTPARLRRMRGAEVATILQDPLHSLTPWLRIGTQVAEPAVVHDRLSWKAAQARALDLLRGVWIPEPERRLRSYPHEMSGGMRQRVAGAVALSCAPRLLIADEPTTALDPTIQLQYLDLLKSLQREHGFALILITHDLGVVARTCQRVGVMYGGRFVEIGTTAEVMERPRHPYTRGLIASMPRLRSAGSRSDRLAIIPGQPPVPGQMPPGCRFHPRCAQRFEPCDRDSPPAFDLGSDRRVACWLERAFGT